MKYVFVVCFLIGGSALLKAQNNFTKGYYVTWQRDTVRGFLQDRSDLENFNACIFKPSLEGKTTTFSPKEIIAFGFDSGGAYQKITFKEKSGDFLEGFFQLIVKGKLTLTSYNTRYFAITDTQEIYEVTRTSTEASGRVKENFQGLGHLKILMNDCPTTNEKWLLKEYSDKNLKKIFITYNSCVKSSLEVFDREPTKILVEAGLQILPSFVTMHAGYPLGDLNSNKTVAGGAFLSVKNPRNWDNITLLLEANYYQYNGYGFFSTNDNSGKTNNDVFAKYSALQVPLYIRVGQKFFIDVGVQNHLLVKQDSRWRVEAISNHVETADVSMANRNIWTLGVMAGVGANFDLDSHPLKVFARYSRCGKATMSLYQLASIGVSFQLTNN